MDFDLDALLKKPSSVKDREGGRGAKRDADGDIVVASSAPASAGASSRGSAADSDLVRAIGRLALADSKLCMQNDLRLRTILGGHMSVLKTPKADDQIILAMKAATREYESKTHGQKGHALGTPLQWAFRALLLQMSREILREDARDALARWAKDLVTPVAFRDVISHCGWHEAFDAEKGVLIEVAFGERGLEMKTVFYEYFDGIEGC